MVNGDINTEDEDRLVGAATVTPRAVRDVPPLPGEAFVDWKNRQLWSAVVALVTEASGEPPITAIVDRATKDGQLNPETRETLVRHAALVMDGVPRFSDLNGLAEVVRSRWVARGALDELRREFSRVVRELRMPGRVESPLEAVSSVAFRLGEESSGTRPVMDGDVAREVAAAFDEFATGIATDAVPTGIRALDRRLGGGFRPGKLYVIASSTGGGKTAFGSQVCDQAIYRGKTPIFFSMELAPVDVVMRDVERRAGVSRWQMRARERIIRERAQDAIMRELARLPERRKLIVPGSVTVETIRQITLSRMARGPIDLVVVDHAQVVEPDKRASASMPRYLAVKATAEGLRAMAQRLNVAVVLTAQMNPPAKGEQPSMALIRESKDLCNTADVVLLLWHDRGEDGTIEASRVMIQKSRAGSPGDVDVRFIGETFTYVDIDDDDEGDRLPPPPDAPAEDDSSMLPGFAPPARENA